MNPLSLVHMELKGQPYELGRQHGQRCPTLVRRAFDFYCASLSLADQMLLASLTRLEQRLQTWAPEIIEELHGIADGAGLPYPHILALNLFGELHHCTAIGFPRTDEGPLLGKTDDVTAAERELEVFQRIEPAQGYALIQYTIAGTVWCSGGMNERGLGLVMTGLLPGRIPNPVGLPSLILKRWLLHRCATVGEALALLRETEVVGPLGSTFGLADPASAEVVMVEKYPGLQAERWSGPEPIVTTNGCLALEPPAAEASFGFYKASLGENSRHRYENVLHRVNTVEPNVVNLRALLADHSRIGAICQHGQDNLHTSFAMILAPRRLTMWAAEGYACAENWVTWRV